MVNVNDTLARACHEALHAQQQLIAQVVREGQERGDITRHASADALSQLLIDTWQGVLMCMKTTRSHAPLNNFLTLYFDYFLKA